MNSTQPCIASKKIQKLYYCCHCVLIQWLLYYCYCPLHHHDYCKCNFVFSIFWYSYRLPEYLITCSQQGCSAMSYLAKHLFKISVTLYWEGYMHGVQGPSITIQHQWADVHQTSHLMYGLLILLSICRVCTLTFPHWWAILRYNFYLHQIMT